MKKLNLIMKKKKLLIFSILIASCASLLAVSPTEEEEDACCGSVRFEPAEVFGFKTTTDIIQDLVLGLQANYKLYVAAKQNKGSMLELFSLAGRQSEMLDSIKDHLMEQPLYNPSEQQRLQISIAEEFVEERQHEYYDYFIALSALFDPNPQQ